MSYASTSQISTWAPSSTARFGGMRKNTLVAAAVVDSPMKMLCRDPSQGRTGRGYQGLTAEEERGLHLVVGQAMQATARQGGGHVGLLHEAVACHHGVEALAQAPHLDTPRLGDARHVHGQHVHQDDALVQNLVVLEVVQQGERNGADVAGHEHRGAGDAQRRALHALEEGLDRQRAALQLLVEQRAAAPPRRDQVPGAGGHQEREPGAVGIFSTVAEKKARSMVIQRAEGGTTADIGFQRQIRMATTQARMASMVIAPVTAMP